MSMEYWALRVTPPQIGALRAEPRLGAKLIGALSGYIYELWKQPPPAPPELAADLAMFKPLQPVLALGNDWHILHYLLSGHAWTTTDEPEDTLLSGEELGDEDVGYGPPRLISSGRMNAFDGLLARLDADTLSARIDLGRMEAAGVYGLTGGNGLSEQERFAGVASALRGLPQLKAYVTATVRAKSGWIAWLS